MIKQIKKRPSIINLIVLNIVDYSLLGLAERDGYFWFGTGGSWLCTARQEEKEWLPILRITLLAVTHLIPLRLY